MTTQYQTAGVRQHQCASIAVLPQDGAPLTKEVGFIGQVQLDACTQVVASMKHVSTGVSETHYYI
jgi:hypothetical protein